MSLLLPFDRRPSDFVRVDPVHALICPAVGLVELASQFWALALTAMSLRAARLQHKNREQSPRGTRSSLEDASVTVYYAPGVLTVQDMPITTLLVGGGNEEAPLFEPDPVSAATDGHEFDSIPPDLAGRAPSLDASGIGGGTVWEWNALDAALAQTLGFGIAGALVTCVLAFPIAWISIRHHGRFSRILEGGTYISSSLPGIVVALAFVTVACPL
jgi:ABC-type Fe3+ transport system permease subunit